MPCWHNGIPCITPADCHVDHLKHHESPSKIRAPSPPLSGSNIAEHDACSMLTRCGEHFHAAATLGSVISLIRSRAEHTDKQRTLIGLHLYTACALHLLRRGA
ncbi:hypothetical protein M3J09_001418 [Ascochyta lentis]